MCKLSNENLSLEKGVIWEISEPFASVLLWTLNYYKKNN